MRKFLLAGVIAGLIACGDSAKTQKEIDTLNYKADTILNKADTLINKIVQSDVADSIKSKGGKVLDSAKAKGGRLLNKVEENLGDLKIKHDSTK
ncbi:MAG: hypothetical protein M3Y85_03315 [Bacteroidota bacterium]|nr:hypothetical protein [Bacteroidota bacterium]